MAKVSVIIPCYNREKFIKETINSVLHQTYGDIELIVVDDGATDNSRQVLDSFGDRVRVLEHPGRVNKGQSAALNLGITESQGEYLALLDSDDLFAPDKIEKQVAFLEENPNIGLVYSNGHAIDEVGNILYRFYGDNHQELSDPCRILMDCYFLLPNNSMFRRSVLESAGLFDETLRSAQDHDLLIRIVENTKIAYLNQCLFYYRRHKDSISQKSAKLRWKNGYKILNKARLRYNYPFFVVLKRLAVLNFRIGQCYKEENKKIISFIFFIFSGLCDPFRAMKVLIKKEKIGSHH